MTQGGRKIFVYVNEEVEDAVNSMLFRLPHARIIRSPVNQGLGFALNELARRAFAEGYEHVFLLDQDSGPSADLPEALRQRWAPLSASLGPLAAVGPMLEPAVADYRLVRYYWRDEARGVAAFLPTSGSLISANAFADVGDFRADYFIDGIDVEWGVRAMRRGYATAVVSDLSVPHRWGVPTAAGQKPVAQILRQSSQRTYYHVRNTIDLLRSTRPSLRLTAALAATLAAQVGLLLLRKGRDRAVRRAIVSGLRDGSVFDPLR